MPAETAQIPALPAGRGKHFLLFCLAAVYLWVAIASGSWWVLAAGVLLASPVLVLLAANVTVKLLMLMSGAMTQAPEGEADLDAKEAVKLGFHLLPWSGLTLKGINASPKTCRMMSAMIAGTAPVRVTVSTPARLCFKTTYRSTLLVEEKRVYLMSDAKQQMCWLVD